MAGLSGSGSGSGNRKGEGPSNDSRPSLKRPRVSTPKSDAQRSTAAAAVSTDPHPSCVAAAASSSSIEPGVGSDSETDSTWSGSSSGSESESERDSMLSSGSEDESGHERGTDEPEDSAGYGDGASGGSRGGSGWRLSGVLSDLEVLDCPVCCEPLCSPVYQCENGHVACASCCTKMRNKCSNCRSPIGTIRCRALEKVLESVTVACRNLSYGCTEKLSYNKILDHEIACDFALCMCPHASCNYKGMSNCLYTHFSQVHVHSTKKFVFGSVISVSLAQDQMHAFFQETSQSTLFILNRSVKDTGSFVNIVCVAPASSNGKFLYDLTVILDRDTSIKIKASVVCVPKCAQMHTRKCLALPSDLMNKNRPLQLELIISRNPAFAC